MKNCKIRLDPHLCEDFLLRGISDVNVDIIKSGCAGSKISLSPRNTPDERISSEENNGIRCWILPDLIELLDDSQIARAKGKYFLVTKKIQSRCGCGTSFSFEKKTVPADLAKIHRLQSILKSSPEVERFQKILSRK